MENNAFKAFTPRINNGDEFPEISGWESFWDEVSSNNNLKNKANGL
jgi:hypothetical protein